jgi:hypothetical protein
MYFLCVLYFSLFLSLHVSGAIYTHPQEHKLQRTAIGVCNGFVMLIHYTHEMGGACGAYGGGERGAQGVGGET